MFLACVPYRRLCHGVFVLYRVHMKKPPKKGAISSFGRTGYTGVRRSEARLLHKPLIHIVLLVLEFILNILAERLDLKDPPPVVSFPSFKLPALNSPNKPLL